MGEATAALRGGGMFLLLAGKGQARQGCAPHLSLAVLGRCPSCCGGKKPLLVFSPAEVITATAL